MTRLIASIGSFATAALITAQASAAYYVPGAWDSDAWNPLSNVMTDDGGGLYSVTITGQTASSKYEFKVVEDGDWNTSVTDDNSWVYANGAGEVTLTLDTNAAGDGWSPDINRIGNGGGAENNPGTGWTVVGLFQGWDNASATTAMTDDGGGLYSLSTTIAAIGSHEWKISNTGDWDQQFGAQGRGTNAATLLVETTAANQSVTFSLNVVDGTIKAVAVPEPASLALMGAGGLLILSRRRMTADRH